MGLLDMFRPKKPAARRRPRPSRRSRTAGDPYGLDKYKGDDDYGMSKYGGDGGPMIIPGVGGGGGGG